MNLKEKVKGWAKLIWFRIEKKMVGSCEYDNEHRVP
jgi:hypothetical protein